MYHDDGQPWWSHALLRKDIWQELQRTSSEESRATLLRLLAAVAHCWIAAVKRQREGAAEGIDAAGAMLSEISAAAVDAAFTAVMQDKPLFDTMGVAMSAAQEQFLLALCCSAWTSLASNAGQASSAIAELVLHSLCRELAEHRFNITLEAKRSKAAAPAALAPYLAIVKAAFHIGRCAPTSTAVADVTAVFPEFARLYATAYTSEVSRWAAHVDEVDVNASEADFVQRLDAFYKWARREHPCITEALQLLEETEPSVKESNAVAQKRLVSIAVRKSLMCLQLEVTEAACDEAMKRRKLMCDVVLALRHMQRSDAPASPPTTIQAAEDSCEQSVSAQSALLLVLEEYFYTAALRHQSIDPSPVSMRSSMQAEETRLADKPEDTARLTDALRKLIDCKGVNVPEDISELLAACLAQSPVAFMERFFHVLSDARRAPQDAARLDYNDLLFVDDSRHESHKLDLRQVEIDVSGGRRIDGLDSFTALHFPRHTSAYSSLRVWLERIAVRDSSTAPLVPFGPAYVAVRVLSSAAVLAFQRMLKASQRNVTSLASCAAAATTIDVLLHAIFTLLSHTSECENSVQANSGWNLSNTFANELFAHSRDDESASHSTRILQAIQQWITSQEYQARHLHAVWLPLMRSLATEVSHVVKLEDAYASSTPNVQTTQFINAALAARTPVMYFLVPDLLPVPGASRQPPVFPDPSHAFEFLSRVLRDPCERELFIHLIAEAGMAFSLRSGRNEWAAQHVRSIDVDAAGALFFSFLRLCRAEKAALASAAGCDVVELVYRRLHSLPVSAVICHVSRLHRFRHFLDTCRPIADGLSTPDTPEQLASTSAPVATSASENTKLDEEETVKQEVSGPVQDIGLPEGQVLPAPQSLDMQSALKEAPADAAVAEASTVGCESASELAQLTTSASDCDGASSEIKASQTPATAEEAYVAPSITANRWVEWFWSLSLHDVGASCCAEAQRVLNRQLAAMREIPNHYVVKARVLHQAFAGQLSEIEKTNRELQRCILLSLIEPAVAANQHGVVRLLLLHMVNEFIFRSLISTTDALVSVHCLLDWLLCLQELSDLKPSCRVAPAVMLEALKKVGSVCQSYILFGTPCSSGSVAVFWGKFVGDVLARWKTVAPSSKGKDATLSPSAPSWCRLLVPPNKNIDMMRNAFADTITTYQKLLEEDSGRGDGAAISLKKSCLSWLGLTEVAVDKIQDVERAAIKHRNDLPNSIVRVLNTSGNVADAVVQTMVELKSLKWIYPPSGIYPVRDVQRLLEERSDAQKSDRRKRSRSEEGRRRQRSGSRDPGRRGSDNKINYSKKDSAARDNDGKQPQGASTGQQDHKQFAAQASSANHRAGSAGDRRRHNNRGGPNWPRK